MWSIKNCRVLGRFSGVWIHAGTDSCQQSVWPRISMCLRCGEGEQEVGAGKVETIGRGAQRDPLQLAGRHNDAALLANQFSKVGIVLHIMNDDRGAENEAVASRVIAERARTRDIVE